MGRRKSIKWRNDKALVAVVCVLAAVCLLAGGIYIDTFHGSGKLKGLMTQTQRTEEPTTKAEAQPLESMPVDAGSKATVAVFDKEFMLCTKDGVKYFRGMDDQKWSDTFNMTSPVLAQEGEYVAVGDLGGKTLRVYNKEGLLYDLQTEGTPVQFALNESGYLSLITKANSSYRIRVYNTKGTLLKERVEESNGIYPLSSDVSEDNRAFAVSYLDTTDIAPIARVILFYINAEDSESYTDSMFAAVEKPNELIPVVHYRKGSVLAAISDQNIYGIDAQGQELWSYELENTVDQAAFGMKEYIVVALGDSVADKDGREKGTICWIDNSGKEKAAYESGRSVTYLSAGERGVVAGNDRNYFGLTHGGNLNWNYTATADVSDLLPMEKFNRVMVIGKEQIDILKMSKDDKAVQKASTENKATEPDAMAETDQPLLEQTPSAEQNSAEEVQE